MEKMERIRAFMILIIGVLLVNMAEAIHAQDYTDSAFDFHPRNEGTASDSTLSFWTIHCEYPGGTPEHPSLVGTGHWEGLVDKINYADSNGVKLSLAMTGRWADAIMNDGHQSTILSWINNGHIVGTHTDPERKEGSRWIVYNWGTIPEDKMQQAIDDAITAVNNVVGVNNNKHTDNPAVFWSAFGGKGYFHKQMTHLLIGNFGHNYPCRIFLSDGREITLVAYCGVIQRNTQNWGVKRISPEDMIIEYNEGGEAYGPVHFPGGLTNNSHIEWMEWLNNNNKPRVRATTISAPYSGGCSLDRFVRMWTEYEETPDVSLATTIIIKNSSNTDLTNIKITHYMPLTYCNFQPGSDSPPVTYYATILRRHLIWDNQTIPKKSTVTYVYTGNRTDIPGTHRIENRADTYLDDLSAIPLIARRFAMFDLGDWDFLPFESVAFTPPNTPTNPLCESQTNPTDVVNPTPEFSWTYSDPDVMDTQQTYRILVASSLSDLNANNGDMWDSDKAESTDSIVTYAGSALADYIIYYWKVMTMDPIGYWSPYCSAQSFMTDSLFPSVEENGFIAPKSFYLSQNYPNPFTQKTVIAFRVQGLELKDKKLLTLKIYDLAGRMVKTLFNSELSTLNSSEGFREQLSVSWDGRNDLGKSVSSGIYFYKLKVGKFSQTKKLLILR